MKRQRTPSANKATKRPRLSKPALRRTKSSVSLAPEKKFNDVTFTNAANLTGYDIGLTSIGAGDTALLRDGNKIMVKSIYVKLTGSNKSLTQNNTVRIALVKNLQANGGNTSWNNVYDSLSVTAQRNVQTVSQFQVIWDQVIDLNQGSDGALQRFFFEKFVKVPPETTTYAQSAAQTPMTNAYSLLYLGSTALGGNDMAIQGSARVRFIG